MKTKRSFIAFRDAYTPFKRIANPLKHPGCLRVKQTKFSSYIILLICILFLSSCKKEIVSEDIYGVWVMQKQSSEDGPQYNKLILDKEDYNWIDPIVNDTIFFFKKIAVNSDTLLLTDGFNHPYTCIIEELHDSVLTLSNISGFDKEITYKKVLDFNNGPFPPETCNVSNISKDSLDVIVKSFLVWDYFKYLNEELKEEKFYHSLTKAEMIQARELLRQYMADGSLEKNHGNNNAYPFDQYIRQYVSYTEKGHLYVRITLNKYVFFNKNIVYTALKQDVYTIEDGGPIHANAIIDLTANKVVLFMTNGEA
jgi:hypothetical protein